MKTNLLFTLSIIIASLFAFGFPHWLVEINGFATKTLIIPLLMLIMFGMGTHISLAEFVEVWKRPKSLFVGVGLQFLVMPAIGFALAFASDLPTEVAAGILLVGCSPSGLASNVMCFIARANLALSVSLTTCATLLAPFATPFLMVWLASEYVAIAPAAMFMTMLKLVLVPVVAGMVVNHYLPKTLSVIFSIMPLVSMAGIIVIVAIIIANGQQALAQIGWILVLLVIIHNTAGFLLGYLGGKLAKCDEASCRALAFEVGMQNSGLASGLAVTMKKVATMGLAAALFSSIQNITGSILAAYWASQHEAKP